MYINQLQGKKEPVTPEAKKDSGDDQTSIKQERIKENVEKSAKILADEGKQVNKAVEYQELVKSIWYPKSLILTNQLIRYKKGCWATRRHSPAVRLHSGLCKMLLTKLVEMEINTTGENNIVKQCL